MSPRTLLSAVSMLGFAFGASACATAVVGNNDPGHGGDAQAPKTDGGTPKEGGSVKTPTDAGGGTPTDDAGAPIVDDSTCAADSTRQACEQCCLGVHPSGYAVYHQELLSCVCQTPAACASECATEFCVQKPTTANDACEQCINGALAQGGACYDGIANTCQSDTDCTSLFQVCIPPCETK